MRVRIPPSAPYENPLKCKEKAYVSRDFCIFEKCEKVHFDTLKCIVEVVKKLSNFGLCMPLVEFLDEADGEMPL